MKFGSIAFPEFSLLEKSLALCWIHNKYVPSL
jgi:hypothetical protein